MQLYESACINLSFKYFVEDLNIPFLVNALFNKLFKHYIPCFQNHNDKNMNITIYILKFFQTSFSKIKKLKFYKYVKIL